MLKYFGLGAVAAFAFSAASHAATYSYDFTADPTSFVCGYFVTSEICGTGGYLDTPAVLNTGDTVDVNVEYSAPLHVPGSLTANNLYVVLADTQWIPGPALPGDRTATVTSQVQGYSGALPPIVGPFSTSTLNGYLAAAVFCCGYGLPNNGFSATAISSHFSIESSDPNPIYAALFGYSVELPATPQSLADFQGGTVDHPVILPPGLVGQITSAISGDGPSTDFYDFVWNGGLFQAQGSIDGANPLADFHFQLFELGSDSPIADEILNNDNAFNALISMNLDSGEYVIGMTTASPYDPQLTITFNTPVGTAAPEPATFGLLGAGFFVVRRLRSRQGVSRLS